jgi:hypothetical protein
LFWALLVSVDTLCCCGQLLAGLSLSHSNDWDWPFSPYRAVNTPSLLYKPVS